MLFPAFLGAVQTSYGQIHTVNLQANAYRFIKTDLHQDRIRMDGFGSITLPGHPQLPTRVFYIALPIGASVENISLQPHNIKILPGSFDIMSAPPMVSTHPESGNESFISPDYEENKSKFYTTDAYLPHETASVVGIDTWNNAPLVKIRFTPFSYNPSRKELRITHELSVHITYSDPAAVQRGVPPIDESICRKENWIDDRSLLQEPSKKTPVIQAGNPASLLIIGPSDVENAVAPFIQWKSFLGITTEFVSTEHIYSEIAGNDKTEKIRNMLKIKHNEAGVTHALLIGYEDTIPMKKLYPDANNHTSSGAIPTDYYYSELSSHWDGDGDGYPGEHNDDNGDWAPELVVGRIPWSNHTIVGDILNKSILFEQDCGSWKTDALLVGAMANYKQENNSTAYFTKTDGAVLMEILKKDLFSNSNFTTLYEKEGIDSSIYDCDLPLTQDNLSSTWSSESFGCVTWWAHGSYQSASRKWWRGDDGDNIPESGEIGWQKFIMANNYPVNPQYQPIVFANSCDNGWPELASLGRTLIKDGCSGIVSSSRTSWYILGWNDVQYGGNATLTYYFWDQLISKPQSVGEAISNARMEYIKNFNVAWQHIHNVYVYNYFGDPTLSLTGRTPQYGGLSGVVLSGGGVPQQGTCVEITSLSLSAKTDENGGFQFLAIPGGTYTLSFSGGNCPDFDTEVTLVNGEITRINIFIPSQAVPDILTDGSFLNISLHEDTVRTTYLNVINTGSADLHVYSTYNSTQDAWLDVDSTTLTIPPGVSDSIRVSFRSLGLDQGLFETQFQLITNVEKDSIISFPVSMTVMDTIAPAAINDLVLREMENDSVTLAWTAPGDNNLSGIAERYEIWISEEEPNAINSGNGNLIYDGLTPKTSGSSEEIRIPITSTSQTQWIWITTWDEAGFSSNSNSINLVSTGTSETITSVPRDFVTQNYPNPFNGITQIEYGISKPGKVQVTIYNERGQLVKCLVNENLSAGQYTTAWHAMDAYDRPVSSGIYFYAVETESQRTIQKMLYLK